MLAWSHPEQKAAGRRRTHYPEFASMPPTEAELQSEFVGACWPGELIGALQLAALSLFDPGDPFFVRRVEQLDRELVTRRFAV